jgi:hypothetical protein
MTTAAREKKEGVRDSPPFFTRYFLLCTFNYVLLA